MWEWREQNSRGRIKKPERNFPQCAWGGGWGQPQEQKEVRVGGTSRIATPVGNKNSSSHGDMTVGVTREQEHVGRLFSIHAYKGMTDPFPLTPFKDLSTSFN